MVFYITLFKIFGHRAEICFSYDFVQILYHLANFIRSFGKMLNLFVQMCNCITKCLRFKVLFFCALCNFFYLLCRGFDVRDCLG